MGNLAMRRRWRPWTLTLALTAALTVACCGGGTAATTESPVRPAVERGDGLLSGVLRLPATMARALKRIRESPHDHQLAADVWFEKTPRSVRADHTMERGPESPPSPGDLFDMADAVFDTHHLLWRNPVLEGIDLKVYKDKSRRYTFDLALNNGTADEKTRNSDRRTFGVHRRRMHYIMLPIMYKLGVITTLLFGLTLLTLKGVTIGMVLLILGLSSLVVKFTKYNYYPPPQLHSFPPPVHEIFDRSSHHQPPPVYLQSQAHSQAQSHSQSQPQSQSQPHQDKNVHVHVHAASNTVKSHPPSHIYRDSPYSPPDDNNSGPADSNWNYDAVMNTYYQKGPNGYSSVPKTTTNSAYTHWIG